MATVHLGDFSVPAAINRKTVGNIAIELLVNIALPYAIYVKAALGC
jgi:hypothetical protein